MKNRMPGWKMSRAQAAAFWRLWAEVMRVQRWPAGETEGRRKGMLAELGFGSIKEVDGTDGFDRVKGWCLERSDVVVNEAEDAGQRRRYLHRIGEQMGELTDLGFAPGLETVLKERFKVAPRTRAVEDLSTVELERCVMTLDRLIFTRRRTPEEVLTGVEDNPF